VFCWQWTESGHCGLAGSTVQSAVDDDKEETRDEDGDVGRDEG